MVTEMMSVRRSSFGNVDLVELALVCFRIDCGSALFPRASISNSGIICTMRLALLHQDRMPSHLWWDKLGARRILISWRVALFQSSRFGCQGAARRWFLASLIVLNDASRSCLFADEDQTTHKAPLLARAPSPFPTFSAALRVNCRTRLIKIWFCHTLKLFQSLSFAYFSDFQPTFKVQVL